MKIHILILLTLFIANIALGQSLKMKVPKGSKVYVLGPTKVIVDAALDELNKWGYWQLATTKKDADYFIYLYVDKRTYMDFDYSAEIRNKKDDVVYSTGKTNSAVPNGGVVKMIRKCMERKVHE